MSLTIKPQSGCYLCPTNRTPAQLFATVMAHLQTTQNAQSLAGDNLTNFHIFMFGALPDVRIQVQDFVFCRNRRGTSVEKG